MSDGVGDGGDLVRAEIEFLEIAELSDGVGDGLEFEI